MSTHSKRGQTYGVYRGRQDSSRTIGFWPEPRPLPFNKRKKNGIWKRWAANRATAK